MPIVIGKIKLSENKTKKFNVSNFTTIQNIGPSTAKYIISLLGKGIFSRFGVKNRIGRGTYSSTMIKLNNRLRKTYYWDKFINNRFNFDSCFYFGKDFEQRFYIKKKKIRNSGSIRGFKMKLGLPLHGQRTHSNAGTSKRYLKSKKKGLTNAKYKQGVVKSKKKLLLLIFLN